MWALSDGRGRQKVVIELVLEVDEADEPLWTIETEVRFDDPTRVSELAVNASSFEIPRPGNYKIQLPLSFVAFRRYNL